MKKVLVTIVGLMFCAGLVTCPAAGKRELTPEQKAIRKELIEKYDTNKDRKLDKEERAKMTAEDKEKWTQAMGGGKKAK